MYPFAVLILSILYVKRTRLLERALALDLLYCKLIDKKAANGFVVIVILRAHPTNASNKIFPSQK